MPQAACSRVLSVSACSRAVRSAPRSAPRRATARSARAPQLAARSRAQLRRPTLGSSPASRVPSSRPASASRHAASAAARSCRGDQRQIVAVRRHPRQRGRAAAPRIGLQQLPHQDRRRPAVHQQVMVADQQPVPLAPKPDQRKPHQRRRRQIEPLQAIRRERSRSAAACCSRASQPRQIDQPPRHLDPRQHHLHRAGSSCSCRKPDRRLACRPTTACNEASSTPRIERALELKLKLHRIDVRPLRIVERMEQQPLLQRRQRQDVLDRAGSGSPAARSRPASDATSARSLGVRPPAPGCAACRASAVSARNQLCRQIAHRSLARAAPAAQRPVRRKPRAVRPVQRQRIDLDQHAPAASPDRRRPAARHRLRPRAHPGSPAPSPHHRRRREPAQIVEAELRRRQTAQAAPPSRR